MKTGKQRRGSSLRSCSPQAGGCRKQLQWQKSASSLPLLLWHAQPSNGSWLPAQLSVEKLVALLSTGHLTSVFYPILSLGWEPCLCILCQHLSPLLQVVTRRNSFNHNDGVQGHLDTLFLGFLTCPHLCHLIYSYSSKGTKNTITSCNNKLCPGDILMTNSKTKSYADITSKISCWRVRRWGKISTST